MKKSLKAILLAGLGAFLVSSMPVQAAPARSASPTLEASKDLNAVQTKGKKGKKGGKKGKKGKKGGKKKK